MSNTFSLLFFSYSQLLKVQEIFEAECIEDSIDGCSLLDNLERDYDDSEPTFYLWMEVILNESEVVKRLQDSFPGFHVITCRNDLAVSFYLHPDFAKDREVTLYEWLGLLDEDDWDEIKPYLSQQILDQVQISLKHEWQVRYVFPNAGENFLPQDRCATIKTETLKKSDLLAAATATTIISEIETVLLSRLEISKEGIQPKWLQKSSIIRFSPQD